MKASFTLRDFPDCELAAERNFCGPHGYAGGGAMIPYGQPAPFGAAVEEIIIEKIADLMHKTAN